MKKSLLYERRIRAIEKRLFENSDASSLKAYSRLRNTLSPKEHVDKEMHDHLSKRIDDLKIDVKSKSNREKESRLTGRRTKE